MAPPVVKNYRVKPAQQGSTTPAVTYTTIVMRTATDVFVLLRGDENRGERRLGIVLGDGRYETGAVSASQHVPLPCALHGCSCPMAAVPMSLLYLVRCSFRLGLIGPRRDRDLAPPLIPVQPRGSPPSAPRPKVPEVSRLVARTEPCVAT